jgi:hypothetical protein
MLVLMARDGISGFEVEVCVERGRKRVFAAAVEWPGWCRSGKDEASALGALAAVEGRYEAVAERAGFPLPTGRPLDFRVVESVEGTSSTDFGVPGVVCQCDLRPLDRERARRLEALLLAAWGALELVIVSAPEELRKGPRGGGRNRDAIAEHVLGAEAIYARKLGIRLRQPAPGDAEAVAGLRGAIREAVRAGAERGQVPEGEWPLRYAVRRMAWHVLDHAWEIEDRSSAV